MTRSSARWKVLEQIRESELAAALQKLRSNEDVLNALESDRARLVEARDEKKLALQAKRAPGACSAGQLQGESLYKERTHAELAALNAQLVLQDEAIARAATALHDCQKELAEARHALEAVRKKIRETAPA